MIDLQACLISLLTDVDAMRKFLIQPGGMKEEIIPWADAKKAFALASDSFLKSGGTKAISKKVLESEMEQYFSHQADAMGEMKDEYIEPTWLTKKFQTDYFQRSMQERLKDASKDGTFNSDLDVGVAVEKGRQLISDLSAIAVASSMDRPLAPMSSTMPVWAEDVLHRRMREESGEVRKPITFGFDAIDQAFQGIREEELVIVGAVMKAGKSWIACKQGLKAAQDGNKVAIWALENSENETYARLVSLAGPFAYSHISDATIPPGERDRFREVVGQEVFDRIYVKHAINATLEEMYYQSATLGMDLLIGDQFTFVNWKGSSREADWERYSNMAHRAKSLSQETRMPSVWVTQLNREAINKAEPGGKQIGRSIGLGQAADFFFFLSEDPQLGMDKRRYSMSLSRRTASRDWSLDFRFNPMHIEVDREINH